MAGEIVNEVVRVHRLHLHQTQGTQEVPDAVATRQKYRHLQEKANRYSCAQASQRMRARSCSRTPHARNCSATLRHDGTRRAVLAGEAVVVDGPQPMQMIRH